MAVPASLLVAVVVSFLLDGLLGISFAGGAKIGVLLAVGSALTGELTAAGACRRRAFSVMGLM